MGIAENAGVGSTSGQLFLDEILDHTIPELLASVEDVMSKSMFHCCLPCIIETIDIATPGFFFASSTAAVVPGFHSNTYYFIPLRIEHEGGNGTIYTAAHGYQHFSFFAHGLKK